MHFRFFFFLFFQVEGIDLVNEEEGGADDIRSIFAKGVEVG